MRREGTGMAPPKRRTIDIDRACMLTLLPEAELRASYRGYAKGNTYRVGMLPPINIQGVGYISQEVRPIFAGLIGEYATTVPINVRFHREVATCDLSLRRTGDHGIDLECFGMKVQVKTRQKPYDSSLVKREAFTAHAFVFCEWIPPNQYCDVLGWVWKDAVTACKTRTAKRGAHVNYVVPDSRLLPMNSFCDALEALSYRD